MGENRKKTYTLSIGCFSKFIIFTPTWRLPLPKAGSLLGTSLVEAKAESQHNSGILNVQLFYALDLVKMESEKTKEPTYRYGVDIAKAVEALP
ncbi:hypothetical protein [Sphaerochaeta globosa]|uniref:hypothetical protein n=1 Tax=Sphaerochaeta globosa TaxID=1131703 RepID=UPI00030076BF|nr:hypothetical protein [Sphaerochaeta globosa]